MNRDELRRLLKRKRLQLTESFKLEAEKHVFSHILQTNLLTEAQSVACYMPFNGEVATQLLIHFLWQQEKSVYLPKITDKKDLWFAAYHPNSQLHKNPFHIWEPENGGDYIVPSKLDCVFLPLLAFDNAGNRLGTGQGYYDRTFAFKRESPNNPPLLAGLAYHFQKQDKLDAQDWDVRLDLIITEKEIIQINS